MICSYGFSEYLGHFKMFPVSSTTNLPEVGLDIRCCGKKGLTACHFEVVSGASGFLGSIQGSFGALLCERLWWPSAFVVALLFGFGGRAGDFWEGPGLSLCFQHLCRDGVLLPGWLGCQCGEI